MEKNVDLSKDQEKVEEAAPKVKVMIPKDLEIVGDSGWTMKRKFKKVYPNQLCTCGSGKKAKKCCYVQYR